MKAYILTGPDPEAKGTCPRVELRADHIAIIAPTPDATVGRDEVTIEVRSRAAARHLAYLLCLADDAAAGPEQFAVLAPAGVEPAAPPTDPAVIPTSPPSRDDDLSTLRPGETRSVDGRMWSRCSRCGFIGPLEGVGAYHICDPIAATR